MLKMLIKLIDLFSIYMLTHL